MGFISLYIFKLFSKQAYQSVSRSNWLEIWYIAVSFNGYLNPEKCLSLQYNFNYAFGLTPKVCTTCSSKSIPGTPCTCISAVVLGFDKPNGDDGVGVAVNIGPFVIFGMHSSLVLFQRGFFLSAHACYTSRATELITAPLSSCKRECQPNLRVTTAYDCFIRCADERQ